MKMSHLTRSALGLLLPLTVCSCEHSRDNDTASKGAATADSQQDVKIECQFFYRSSTDTDQGERRQLTITVPFLEGDIPEISLGRSEQIKFKDLACSVSAECNSLVVHFLNDGEQIATLLYQFSDKPGNLLTAGHGFTGLHYIYHPDSKAELQFWAVVKGSDSGTSTE